MPMDNVVDAPGRAVGEALVRMGYKNINGVSVGRFISYETNSENEGLAKKEARDIGEKLKKFHIEEVREPSVTPAGQQQNINKFI